MLFRQKFGPANVTTLIERTSRFLVVLKNAEKRTRPIMAQIAKVLAALPHHARRSITFDRGSELAYSILKRDSPILAGFAAWMREPSRFTFLE